MRNEMKAAVKSDYFQNRAGLENSIFFFFFDSELILYTKKFILQTRLSSIPF